MREFSAKPSILSSVPNGASRSLDPEATALLARRALAAKTWKRASSQWMILGDERVVRECHVMGKAAITGTIPG